MYLRVCVCGVSPGDAEAVHHRHDLHSGQHPAHWLHQRFGGSLPEWLLLLGSREQVCKLAWQECVSCHPYMRVLVCNNNWDPFIKPSLQSTTRGQNPPHITHTVHWTTIGFQTKWDVTKSKSWSYVQVFNWDLRWAQSRWMWKQLSSVKLDHIHYSARCTNVQVK